MNNFQPWLFRVASRPEVAGGHVRRCVTLSQAIRRYASSIFVLDKGGEAWLSKLRQLGFTAVIEGDEPDTEWAGSVLDGYDFSANYAKQLSQLAAPLVVIDDFLAPLSGAHLAINPAPGLEGSDIDGVPALLGSRYALVDERFSRPPPPVCERVTRVLITFGIRDGTNATCLALEAFADRPNDGTIPHISVLLGPNAPYLSMVRKAALPLRDRCNLIIDTDDMTDLLRHTDLVIGAGGVSLLERMASGVPSITVPVSDNQEHAVHGAARCGATLGTQGRERLTASELSRYIEVLSSDFDARKSMSEKARSMVDGRGAARVANVMLRLSTSNQNAL